MQFSDKVYKIVKKIPKGKVTTYKEIGKKLKLSDRKVRSKASVTKAYRAIGQVLRKNPYAPKVPCHRVIRSDGSIGGFKGKTKGKAIDEKIRMLKKEGVEIKNKKIEKRFIHVSSSLSS